MNIAQVYPGKPRDFRFSQPRRKNLSYICIFNTNLVYINCHRQILNGLLQFFSRISVHIIILISISWLFREMVEVYRVTMLIIMIINAISFLFSYCYCKEKSMCKLHSIYSVSVGGHLRLFLRDKYRLLNYYYE